MAAMIAELRCRAQMNHLWQTVLDEAPVPGGILFGTLSSAEQERATLCF